MSGHYPSHYHPQSQGAGHQPPPPRYQNGNGHYTYQNLPPPHMMSMGQQPMVHQNVAAPMPPAPTYSHASQYHGPVYPSPHGPPMPPNHNGNDLSPQSLPKPDDFEYRLEHAREAPPPMAKFSKNYHFEIKVIQQPVRARMCGYGDKDRRPISPPPVVQLIISALENGVRRPIDYSKIENLHRFMCSVDLYNEHGNENVALVVAQTAVCMDRISASQAIPHRHTIDPPSRQGSLPQPNGYGANASHGSPQSYVQSPQSYSQRQDPHSWGVPLQGPSDSAPSQTNRALLGATHGTANRLRDNNQQQGIFFIYPDLSVRSEGVFRLKFRMYDINHSQGLFEPVSSADKDAPCLAAAFSEPFTVHSAKKFPGVCESTDLSKAFATQGIKIPIRKDDGAGKRKRNGDDWEGSDDGD